MALGNKALEATVCIPWTNTKSGRAMSISREQALAVFHRPRELSPSAHARGTVSPLERC
jgi:hypothetical protein